MFPDFLDANQDQQNLKSYKLFQPFVSYKRTILPQISKLISVSTMRYCACELSLVWNKLFFLLPLSAFSAYTFSVRKISDDKKGSLSSPSPAFHALHLEGSIYNCRHSLDAAVPVGTTGKNNQELRFIAYISFLTLSPYPPNRQVIFHLTFLLWSRCSRLHNRANFWSSKLWSSTLEDLLIY